MSNDEVEGPPAARNHQSFTGPSNDEDMTTAELQLVIERVEGESQRLPDEQPAARESAKILALLPRAAEEYREQIRLGLDGHPRSIEKARHALRRLLGQIRLITGENNTLSAEYSIDCATLIRGVVTGGRGRGI